MPIISCGLFLGTKIDDPKNWRVLSSPSYLGPGWRKLRPGAGSADLTLFCPDLAFSPGPNRKVTAPVAFHPHSLSLPHPFFLRSPCSHLRLVSRTLALPVLYVRTYARRRRRCRRAFSRVSFKPPFPTYTTPALFHPCTSPPSLATQKFTKPAVTPTRAGF